MVLDLENNFFSQKKSIKRESILNKLQTNDILLPNIPPPDTLLDSEEERIKQTIENERAMADMNNILLKKDVKKYKKFKSDLYG